MPILRAACGQCGLAATIIQSGDRSATSFDAEECAERCDVGRAASAAGEPVAMRVLECERLNAALRAVARTSGLTR
jgi:hypothetical protein